MLGLLILVTGSSIPAIILHMLSNFISLYFSKNLASFLSSAENSVVLVFLMSIFLLLSLYLLFSSLQTIYEKKSDRYEDGTLIGSRIDAVKSLSRAGRVDKSRKAELVETGTTPRDMLLSPTLLLAVCVYIFITLGVI